MYISVDTNNDIFLGKKKLIPPKSSFWIGNKKYDELVKNLYII